MLGKCDSLATKESLARAITGESPIQNVYILWHIEKGQLVFYNI